MYPIALNKIVRNKTHLSNLPDVLDWQVPPRPGKISKKGILLLPLFEGHPMRSDVCHHVAMSAIWARRSWMVHTDVNDYGIEVKFYVEECIRDKALPILERNFVGEEDVIWYDDGNKLEGLIPNPEGDGYMTYGIKKCASYTDDRFRDYDWIFDIDSDVFAVSARGEKVPFFQKFFENSPKDQIGVCFGLVKDQRSPIGLWCAPEDVEDWKKRFESIAGRAILEKYFNPNERIFYCNGSIIAYPAKHFMNERPEAGEFLTRVSRELLDLEAALSIWHSLGNPIFSVTKHVKLIMLNAHFTSDDVDMFLKVFEREAFLFHYAFPGVDYSWREGIGIYERHS